MIHEARVLLPLLRLAVEPIADVTDAPIVALDRLLDQLLGYQFQLAPFSGFIDGERGLTDGVGEQLLAGATKRITGLSLYKRHC